MHELKIKYGIFPEDKPNRKTEEVYYYNDARGWDCCVVCDLLEGDRWAYTIPEPKERKKQVKDLDRNKLLKMLEESGADINAFVE